MGYLICNGVIWTRLHPYDWEDKGDGEICKIHTLNEMINKQVIHEGREIFVRRRSTFAIDRRRLVGLRGLFWETDTFCDIGAGFYDVHEDTMHSLWSWAITDCSGFVQSKTRIIQRLFRRQRMPDRMRNIRKIKAFQDVACYLPIDVIRHVTESFVNSADSQHHPILTIETKIFRQNSAYSQSFPTRSATGP